MPAHPQHPPDNAACGGQEQAEVVATAIGVQLQEYFDEQSVTPEMHRVLEQIEHCEVRRSALWRVLQGHNCPEAPLSRRHDRDR